MLTEEGDKASKTWEEIAARDAAVHGKEVSGSAQERKNKDKSPDDQGDNEQ